MDDDQAGGRRTISCPEKGNDLMVCARDLICQQHVICLGGLDVTPISVTLPLFVTPDDSMASTAQQTAATATDAVPRQEVPPPAVYKGKVKRSWAQLPDSLVRYVVQSLRHSPRSEHKYCRLITSHYLALVSSKSGYPSQWDAKELWASRLIYTALRNANELEKLMSICAPWHVASESRSLCSQTRFVHGMKRGRAARRDTRRTGRVHRALNLCACASRACHIESRISRLRC